MKMKLNLLIVFLTAVSGLVAADKLSKEFTLTESPTLIIEADAAHVIIEKGSEGKITVEVKVPDKEDFRVSSSQIGDKIRINLEHKGIMSWLAFPLHAIDKNEVVIRAEVPRQCNLELSTDAGRVDVTGISGDIEVNTMSGVVSLDDIEEDVRVSTSTGSVRIEEFSGKLDADVNAGTIKLNNSKGDFLLESNTGRIEVRNSSGRFRASSNMGAIDFEGTITEGEDNFFSSDVGSVKVTLSDKKDLDIDAETDLGDVTIYPKPNKIISRGDRHLAAQIGTGGPKLRIRSDVGSIKIEKGTMMIRGDNDTLPEPETPDATPETTPDAPDVPTPGIKPPTGK
ncbi:DUF4097 family beta strand repeat protein [candidate division WOR-3 bacterium]|uniref:DUF4097 family beta strand repeat protein n=1 Tax=candidate division WOR-3 bacterium TaxID=2052148 RepID=A0A9D5QDC3_UNCW3|nr:DUF4097 family beta strand repeat protein [candidate division WOR-3 bacterium]MBD3365608.1 DUF4097 family beta strand repeat protein [candidate division WOR-3 bacterium]